MLELTRIHCITFGCPPVATKSVAKLASTPVHSTGMFFNVINEGDPVPLVQVAYVKSLLDVYTLSDTDFKERYPDGFRLPEPEFKVSGQCIVLQDPHTSGEGTGDWRAVAVACDVMERKLFGNPIHHLMRHYLTRVMELGHGV